jgi:hypothetical protein
MLHVDGRQKHHERDEEDRDQGLGSEPESEEAGHEGGRREALYQGIAPGDWCPAISTTALEQKEAQYWDVVPGLDGAAAERATRPRPDGGLARRQAVNQNIQIAADNQAQKSGIDPHKRRRAHHALLHHAARDDTLELRDSCLENLDRNPLVRTVDSAEAGAIEHEG